MNAATRQYPALMLLALLWVCASQARADVLEVEGSGATLLTFQVPGRELQVQLVLPTGAELTLDLPEERNHSVYFLASSPGRYVYTAREAGTGLPYGLEHLAPRPLDSATEIQAYQALTEIAEAGPGGFRLSLDVRLERLAGLLEAPLPPALQRQAVFNYAMLATEAAHLTDAANALEALPDADLGPAERAMQLRLLAKVRNEQGRMDESLELLETSIYLYRELAASNPHYAADLAWVTTQSCDALVHQVSDAALPCLEEAQALAADFPAIRAMAIHNTGGYYFESFQFEQAAVQFQVAADIYADIGNLRGQGQATYLVGSSRFQLGQFDQAESKLYEALTLLENDDSPRQRAYVLSRLGNLHAWSGNDSTARDYFQAALDELGDNSSSRLVATIRQGLGDIEFRAGNFHSALDHHLYHVAYEEALETELGARMAEADLAVARDYVMLGDTAQARRYNERAARNARIPQVKADVTLNLARIEDAEANVGGAGHSARTAFESYLALERLPDAIEAGQVLSGILRQQGDWEAAESLGLELFALLQKSVLEFNNYSTAREFYAQNRELSQTLIDTLLQRSRDSGERGYIEKALLVAEQSRALHLRRELLRERIALDGDEADRWNTVNQLHNAVLIAEQSDRVQEVRRLRLALDRARVRATRDYKKNAWLGSLPNSYAEVAASLDPATTYVVYSLGEDASHVFVVNRGEVSAHGLVGRAELDPLIAAAMNALQSPRGSYRAPMRELAQSLLVDAALTGESTRLVVVPDGNLHYLPFSALDAGGGTAYTPLIESVDVEYAPALTLTSSTRLPAMDTVAVVVTEDLGQPATGEPAAALRSAGDANRSQAWNSELVALPWAATEAREIRDIFGTDNTLILDGPLANFDRFRSSAALGYDIIHFATHGYISDSNPDVAGLVLHGSGGEEQVFVHWSEFSSLDLSSKLVVLNGCDTALGRELGGEGMLGLNRAFISAGVPQTLTTLWKVADVPASRIMSTFYAELKNGRSVAKAIRRAQLALPASNPRYRHPFFWAGYVVHTAGLDKT